jgi:hypothetical protein
MAFGSMALPSPQAHLLLAFEYKGGWRDVHGAVVMTVSAWQKARVVVLVVGGAGCSGEPSVLGRVEAEGPRLPKGRRRNRSCNRNRPGAQLPAGRRQQLLLGRAGQGHAQPAVHARPQQARHAWPSFKHGCAAAAQSLLGCAASLSSAAVQQCRRAVGPNATGPLPPALPAGRYGWVHSCSSFNTTFNESGLVGIQVHEPWGPRSRSTISTHLPPMPTRTAAPLSLSLSLSLSAALSSNLFSL